MTDLARLDALCATEIMGWRWFGGAGLWKTNMGWFDGDKYLNYWPKYQNERGGTKEYPRWEPTQKISQAWRLLEKFDSFEVGKYGVRWEETSPNPVDEEYYDVRVLKPGGHTNNWGDSVSEVAATAPLAIVLACLKAKGVPLDQ